MKKKSWFKQHKILSGIIAFILLFIGFGLLGAIAGEDENNYPNEVSVVENYRSFSEIKNISVDIEYRDILRNEEDYVGEWICFDGEILQVVSDKPDIQLRVATKKESYFGYIDEEIYLYAWDYEGERLLEEDIIEFCGEFTGVVDYETVLGVKVSLPGVRTHSSYINRMN